MNSERRTRLLILLGSAVILAIQTGAMYVVSMPSMASLATAQWLAEHVANGSQLVYEFQAGEAHRLTAKWPNSATFIWRLVPTIDSETFGQWLAQGFHYVLIDERTFPGQSFDQRVQSLIGQHATLIYESHNPLNLWPRQAVLWTFRPDHLLNLTFDGSLRLVGYNIEEDNSGPAALLLHWYVTAPAPVAYHLFIHTFDPATGALVGQADAILGEVAHTTEIWRQNEIVFTRAVLPMRSNGTPPDAIQLGLYEFDSGRRATIEGDSVPSSASSGYIEIKLR